MTIEQLQEKRDKAQVAFEKKLNIVAKHIAKKEKLANKLNKLGIDLEANCYEVKDKFGWDAFDTLYAYQRMDDTIKSASHSVRDAQAVLNNWETKLKKEIENMEYINEYCPQVIRDFLDAWEERTVKWYRRRYVQFTNFCKELSEQEIKVGKRVICELATEENKKVFMDNYEKGDMKKCWDLIHNYNHNIRKEINQALKEAELDYRGKNKKKAEFGQLILSMDGYPNEEEREAFLVKTIAEDKKRKLIDFVHRIEKIVGKIEDVSYLLISQQGDIDGLVIGNKGKAKVNTISAGGWNIQCFHYRVLVKEVK